MAEPPKPKTLTKTKANDKDFDTRAASLTYALYGVCFPNVPPITIRSIKHNRITRVAWLAEAETVFGATMLAERLDPRRVVYYRIMGLSVAPTHARRGHGLALMRCLETLVPPGAEIELGVDLNRPSTDWLFAWYTRLGYTFLYERDDEAVMRKRI